MYTLGCVFLTEARVHLGKGFGTPDLLGSEQAPLGLTFPKGRCSGRCGALPRPRLHTPPLKVTALPGTTHAQHLVRAGDKDQAVMTQVRTSLTDPPSSGIPMGSAKAVIGPPTFNSPPLAGATSSARLQARPEASP